MTGGGGAVAWRAAGESGQSTVEVALALPFVLALVLAVVQVGLVVRDEVLVVHAAREAARAAAVHAEVGPVIAAAGAGSGLDPGRLEVVRGSRAGPGSTVEVTVRYRAPTAVPLIGPLVPDVPLAASVSMRVEG